MESGTDTDGTVDGGEPVTLMDPLMVSEGTALRSDLNDRALALAEGSTALRVALPPAILDALGDAVRAMNCYYSNLIEGHDTHPIAIERALARDFSNDPVQRDLQLEAHAHITVQAWIDAGGLSAHPLAPSSIGEIHRRFCEGLPESLLISEDPRTGEAVRVEPGVLRTRFVAVGRHVPPSPGAVPRFLERLHRGYDRGGRLERIVAMACAHHHLAWIHPFVDLNGRVMRMVSHAMARETVGSAGLWSVSRGLARREAEYKRLLASVDAPRHGDRDGRGNLSEAALGAFARFFLETCIDQVAFMTGLMRPRALNERILSWAGERIEAGALPRRSEHLLRLVLAEGEVARGEVAGALGVADRTARHISKALIEAGALTSASSRAPLRLAFSAELAPSWMPGLFPDR